MCNFHEEQFKNTCLTQSGLIRHIARIETQEEDFGVGMMLNFNFLLLILIFR